MGSWGGRPGRLEMIYGWTASHLPEQNGRSDLLLFCIA